MYLTRSLASGRLLVPNRREQEVSKAITTHRKVSYYSDYRDARAVSNLMPGSRVVSYGRGYAIQLRVSGPYYCHEIPGENGEPSFREYDI